jgi:hypothetical protein
MTRSPTCQRPWTPLWQGGGDRARDPTSSERGLGRGGAHGGAQSVVSRGARLLRARVASTPRAPLRWPRAWNAQRPAAATSECAHSACAARASAPRPSARWHASLSCASGAPLRCWPCTRAVAGFRGALEGPASLLASLFCTWEHGARAMRQASMTEQGFLSPEICTRGGDCRVEKLSRF